MNAIVQLPVDSRIAEAEALHRQLRQAMTAGPVSVDGSAVDRVDTSVLQLLAVCQRELQQRGTCMGWVGVSNALRAAAAQLGLTQTLALPTHPSN